MKSTFLFVYGSLIDEGNEFAIYLKGNSTFYSPGKVKGKLYDIGEYPGAVLSAEDDAYIYGNILRIDTPEKVFKVIDDYEGYGGEQSWPNEFTRVLTYIETEIGIINCWIYVYNLPVNGLGYIKGGRYIR
jgi:gamma-glutamylcyclotransferase (GGCT)/AIG2-like uncharacterized protein YtfP